MARFLLILALIAAAMDMAASPARSQVWNTGSVNHTTTNVPIVCPSPTTGVVSQCATSAGGGGSNATIVAPLGSQTAAASVATTINGTLPAFASTPSVSVSGPLGSLAPASGVAVTLDTTDAANLSTIASNSSVGTGTIGSTAPASAVLFGLSDGTDLRAALSDAGGRAIPGQNCTSVINIAQTATTDVYTSTNKVHICSVVLVSSTAQSIGIDEGTGTTCETNGTALIGVSSTASATPQMAVTANSGFSSVSGVPWLQTKTGADHLCVLQSSTGEVAGTITYSDY